MKRKKTGFTLVELLTVLAIITMLVGLLVPSMAMVRRLAKETKQKAHLTSIGLALTAFRDDYGDYPPSYYRLIGDPFPAPGLGYCGAQKLAEALLGRDLLGFHPDSQWRLNDNVYNTTEANLKQRKGRYLELATTNVFKLNGLFDNDPGDLAGDTFVICDVFGAKEVPVGGKIVRAGTPILYYKANTWSKQMIDLPNERERNIYNVWDNGMLVGLGKVGNPTMIHPLLDFFYSTDVGVCDPKVAVPWPYRPDSYILISAGADGLYGTTDDITNFGN